MALLPFEKREYVAVVRIPSTLGPSFQPIIVDIKEKKIVKVIDAFFDIESEAADEGYKHISR